MEMEKGCTRSAAANRTGRADGGGRDGKSSPEFRLLALEPRRLLSVGLSVDTSFGVGGHVITDLANPGTSDDYASGAAVQADGKLIVVGSTPDISNARWTVIRYNLNGTLDTSFAQTGVATYYGGNDTRGYRVAIQPDGKILVLGFTIRYIASSQTYENLLARYNVDGTLDGSFGNGGIVDLGAGTGTGLIVLPGGKILVTGNSGLETGWSVLAAIHRLNSDGTPDATFGTNGLVTYDQKAYSQGLDSPILLSDGGILAVTPVGVEHFDAAGNYVSKFGEPDLFKIAQQSDGKIIGVDSVGTGAAEDMRVLRYNADGTVDTAFGVNGSATIDFYGGQDFPTAILIQADGRIVIGGKSFSSANQTSYDFALARLNLDGSLDDSFGWHGKWLEDFMNTSTNGSDDELFALAQASGNRFYAVGRTGAAAPEDPGTQGTSSNVAAMRFATDVPITVDAGGPYGPVNEGSSFTATANSTYGGGSIAKYEWDPNFTGGVFHPVVSTTSATAQVPTVDGPNAHVALRVTTSDGLSAVGAVNVAVNNVPPTVNLPPVVTGVTGTSVKYAFTITDPGTLDTQSVLIDWGDGTAPQSAAFQPTFFHTYTSRGTYTISVTATDKDGGVSAAATATAKITDIAGTGYFDVNDNATRDATELPAANVTVFLDANGNGQLDAGETQTATDSTGHYVFDGLAPGTYAIAAVLPAGYRTSTPLSGSQSIVVSATKGGVADFGFTQRSAITGIVFNDVNDNHLRDAGEIAPTFGAVAFLDLNGNGKRDANEPQASVAVPSGVYTFRNLDPGTYVIKVVNTGWSQTAPAGAGVSVTIPGVGQLATAADLGLVQSNASIAGTVFNDANQDGNKSSGETGSAGRTVYIDGNNNGVFDSGEISAVTAGDGTYKLANLVAGSYVVRQVVPPGWVGSSPTTGGGAYALTLVAGQTLTAKNFGAYATAVVPAAIGGVSGSALSPFATRITWGAPSAGSPTPDGFRVYRAVSGSQAYVLAGTAPAGASSLDDLADLVPGTTYTYAVDAYQGNYDAPYSSSASVQTAPIVFANGNNRVYLKRDLDGIRTDFWFNSATPGQGTPDGRAILSSTTSLAVSGGSGNDVLTLDYSNGDAISNSSFTFDGGGGSNAVQLIGSVGDDTLNLGSTSFLFFGPTFSISPGLLHTQSIALAGGSGGNDTVNVNGGSWQLDADTAAGTPNVSVTIASGATATFATDQHLANLTVNGGLAQMTAAARKTMTVGGLTIASGGTLDLGVGNLVVSTLNGQPATAAGLQALVKQAAGTTRASGRHPWNGVGGITSSLAQSDAANNNAAGYTIGVADAADNGMTHLGLLTGQVTARVAAYGDADLNNVVDIADLSAWNNGFATGNHWAQGDFNYDGVVDIADLSVWNNNFAGSVSPAGAGREPGVSVGVGDAVVPSSGNHGEVADASGALSGGGMTALGSTTAVTGVGTPTVVSTSVSVESGGKRHRHRSGRRAARARAAEKAVARAVSAGVRGGQEGVDASQVVGVADGRERSSVAGGA